MAILVDEAHEPVAEPAGERIPHEQGDRAQRDDHPEQGEDHEVGLIAVGRTCHLTR